MTTKTVEVVWGELTPDEKHERRLQSWLSPPGVNFASPEAEAGYKARVSRLIDAIHLKKPDRVPVTPHLGEFAPAYCGYTEKDMWYDVDKAIEVANRCTLGVDFQRLTAAGRV